jgi:NTE family protein
MGQQPQYVFGLFEGGGAKGVAYAGIIEACERQGIRFEGACGVSAGAIAASLVAAGMSPANVASLLGESLNDIVAGSSRGWRGRVKSVIRWVGLKGLHSSEGIETWLDGELRRALAINRKVTFNDLPRPLAVLAYDAENGRPHVWSTETTPDYSVARAVRASCSIPFVFAPVDTGENRWYDGGVIENAPSFLIDYLTKHTVLPTMAFRLVSSQEPIIERKRIRGPFRRWMAKVGIVMDARSAIARPRHLDIEDIEIDCGNVDTTDFQLTDAEKSRLIAAGAAAIDRHVQKLATPKQSVAPHHDKGGSLLESKRRHETLARTGRLIRDAKERVDIFAGDISWLEDLAPYLIRATQRGVTIRLLSSAALELDIEHARRLGVSVAITRAAQPLRATICDAHLSSCVAIFVEDSNTDLPSSVSKDGNRRLIDHCAEVFDRLWGQAEKTLVNYEPRLWHLEFSGIESALRTVPQYRNAKVSFEELLPVDVLPACKYVETFKLDRIREVRALYEDLRIEKGYWVVGTPWYSVLPIVEKAGARSGKQVVIDGTHRFYDAYVTGTKVWTIVVHGCEEPLPSTPEESWDRVRLTTAKLERAKRYVDFDGRQFRHIKDALSSAFKRLGAQADEEASNRVDRRRSLVITVIPKTPKK